MVANKKVSGTASSMPGGLAFGWLISMGITLLGAVVLAHMISGEIVRETGIGYGAMVILLLASMLGAATAVKKIKHRRLLVCTLTGMIYYVSLLAMTALFFGGQYQGMGATALIVTAGCGVVIMLGMRQGRGAQSGRRKTRHR